MPTPAAKPVLDVLAGQRQANPPVWMMRQAGRYLAEYRELRAKAGGFLDLVFNAELSAEITLQPIRRFGFDAAIIFSDLPLIPHALGQHVRYETGEGPRLDPLETPAAIDALQTRVDPSVIAPTCEALRIVKRELDARTTLLGFCGAPWTVATYMIAGRGTPDQVPARLFAYRHPESFAKLIDILADAAVDFLVAQLDAGADAVQLFDTWAGTLPSAQFTKWVTAPAQKIVAGVRAKRPGAKIIGFPRGAASNLPAYVDATAVDAVSIDWAAEPSLIRERVQTKVAVQGNLDPMALLAGGDALDRAVDDVLANFAAGRFIFNLGHGITQDTPIANVERMVKRVRAFKG